MDLFYQEINKNRRKSIVSNKTQKNVVWEYVEAIVIAVIIALFIRTFVIQAFKIPSGSMIPTLQIGDHLLVNKFIYGIKLPFTGKTLIPITEPEKGDIVVFRFPKDKSVDYIKRVVATEGDSIEIRKKKVYINGEEVEDIHAYFSSSELHPANVSQRDYYGPVTVPEGKVFVMGDNRDNSYDSRFWGVVDQRDILGKAWIIYWSWDISRPLLFPPSRFLTIQFSRIGNLIR